MAYYEDNFVDYDSNKVKIKWTKELWEYHLNKHPEIQNFKTASSLITKALSNPSIVLAGENVGKKKESTRCYYIEHKRDQSNIYFTKVVLCCSKYCFYVKTVFAQWQFWDLVLQEKKYNNFKEIWRSSKTYL
jgi:hypothetical protein